LGPVQFAQAEIQGSSARRSSALIDVVVAGKLQIAAYSKFTCDPEGGIRSIRESSQFYIEKPGNSNVAMFLGFLLNDKPRIPTNPNVKQLNQGVFWT